LLQSVPGYNGQIQRWPETGARHVAGEPKNAKFIPSFRFADPDRGYCPVGRLRNPIEQFFFIDAVATEHTVAIAAIVILGFAIVVAAIIVAAVLAFLEQQQFFEFAPFQFSNRHPKPGHAFALCR
jgi:hypothetical protein